MSFDAGLIKRQSDLQRRSLQFCDFQKSPDEDVARDPARVLIDTSGPGGIRTHDIRLLKHVLQLGSRSSVARQGIEPCLTVSKTVVRFHHTRKP